MSRFGAMIVTSTVVMYGLMYLNTYALDHVWFSQTRAWMAILMGAAMAVIMLSFMWSMYEKRSIKIADRRRQRACVRRIALAGAQPGDSRRRNLHEGHDPASFDRDHDQRASPHPRSRGCESSPTESSRRKFGRSPR